MNRIIAAVSVSMVFLVAGVLTQAASAADAAAKTDAAKEADATKKADASEQADAKKEADAPADRIVVMYFHRTNRCPTCRAMGGYTEEAVRTGFAKEMEEGKVEFHFVNFQEEKNAALVKSYEVKGPTLVVVRVAANKRAEFKKLADIWEKVDDKDAFIQYVQENVKDYQKKSEKKKSP